MADGNATPDRAACPFCGSELRASNDIDSDADPRGRRYHRYECGTFLWDDEDNDRGRSSLCRKRNP